MGKAGVVDGEDRGLKCGESCIGVGVGGTSSIGDGNGIANSGRNECGTCGAWETYGTSGRFWQILARASQTELHVAHLLQVNRMNPIGAAGLPAIHVGISHGWVESAESNGPSEKTLRCF